MPKDLYIFRKKKKISPFGILHAFCFTVAETNRVTYVVCVVPRAITPAAMGANFEPRRFDDQPTMAAEFARPGHATCHSSGNFPISRSCEERARSRGCAVPRHGTPRYILPSLILLFCAPPVAPPRSWIPCTPDAPRRVREGGIVCCTIRASRNIGCISGLCPEGRPICRPAALPRYVSPSTVLCTPLTVRRSVFLCARDTSSTGTRESGVSYRDEMRVSSRA